MKYLHFHPPGTSLCSTYTEILTFLLSGGDFYYTYTEISICSPSQNIYLLYVYWNINILTLQRWLCPPPWDPQKYSQSCRAWKSNFTYAPLTRHFHFTYAAVALHPTAAPQQPQQAQRQPQWGPQQHHNSPRAIPVAPVTPQLPTAASSSPTAATAAQQQPQRTENVKWNINIFTLPERLFALRIVKY